MKRIIISIIAFFLVLSFFASAEILGADDIKTAQIFSSLKVNDAEKAESVLSLNIADKPLSKESFKLVFNEVCGRVKSYSFQIKSVCDEPIPIYDKFIDNKTVPKIIGYKKNLVSCFKDFSELPIGTTDYKIKADIERGLCDDGFMGYRIDWIPSITLDDKEYVKTDWEWWNTTGGTKYTYIDPETSINYTVHKYTSDGSFILFNNTINVSALVVAGGGGGSGSRGSGGGAGGLIYSDSLTLTAGTYTVIVGLGGFGGVGASGFAGGSSNFSGLNAVGGGFGGYSVPGGSGGAGGGSTDGVVAGYGFAGQGFDGGVGTTDANYGGGGGGGASEIGGNGSGANGGDGGDGLNYSISGSNLYYAGGGGGGGYASCIVGNGGLGGGGAGGAAGGNNAGIAGTANTGGGGGGGHYQTGAPAGGAGGSGVVIIRYETPIFECIENWSITVYGECGIDDLMLKTYEDVNNCGSTNDLPVDNGTFIPCNYCTQNIISNSTECVGGWQTTTYTDLNYSTCCEITGLESDCDILVPPYDEGTRDACIPPVNNVTDCEEYNLTTDFLCRYDPKPLLKDKMNLVCIMPDNDSYQCVVNVFQDQNLLATTPEYKEEGNILLSFSSRQPDARTFFTPDLRLLNAFYTSKSIVTDTPFVVEVLCTSNNVDIVSQVCVTPEYEGQTWILGRSKWASDNASLLIWIFITFLIVAGIIFYVVKVARSGY